MRYDQKLPCTMSIEFPTYEELDADYKHLVDSVSKTSFVLDSEEVGGEEISEMYYKFLSDSISYMKYLGDSSHIKYYDGLINLYSFELPQEYYDHVVSEMGQEFAQKYSTCFGVKFTTINTYLLVHWSEVNEGEKSVATQGVNVNKTSGFKTFDLFKKDKENNDKDNNDDGLLRKGSNDNLRGKIFPVDEGYDLIPIKVKFKVNGVLNTDETIMPVLPIDDKGGLRPKFIDVMPSKDASYLPDKCHLDTFRELSKHHCIVFYDAELIELLRSIDSTAIEEIYIANYEDINVDGSNEDNYYYVKLPKSLYVIDNQCMIHDADDPSLPFDFGRLYEEYDIEISPYYFDKKDETYTGEVYAVVNKEKLGIEEVTGEMIVKTSWEKGIHLGKSGIEVDVDNGDAGDNSDAGNSGDENEDGKKGGTKAIQYLDQLYISPMWCNGQKDMSNMYFMPTDVYNNRMGIFPYVSIGNNGFTNWGSSEMSGFEAVINGVTYGKSGRLVLGFKLDGYPNSQYCRNPDVSPDDLICGYWNPNEEAIIPTPIPTPQVVTAYILQPPDKDPEPQK